MIFPLVFQFADCNYSVARCWRAKNRQLATAIVILVGECFLLFCLVLVYCTFILHHFKNHTASHFPKHDKNRVQHNDNGQSPSLHWCICVQCQLKPSKTQLDAELMVWCVLSCWLSSFHLSCMPTAITLRAAGDQEKPMGRSAFSTFAKFLGKLVFEGVFCFNPLISNG